MSQPNDDDEVTRRRKALNAVRLVCLGPETYDFAAKTFGLKAVEIRAAAAMLGHWLALGGQGASDEEKVAYLLSAGWPRRPSTLSAGGLARRAMFASVR